jgi:cell division protein FtsN
MAKGQDLALNPNKISGLCGRLMCCLSYEFEGRRKQGKALRAPGTRSACIDEQQDETTPEEAAASVSKPAAEAVARPIRPEPPVSPEMPETPPAHESGDAADSVKTDSVKPDSAKKDKRRYFIRRGKFGKRKPKDSQPQ